MKKLLFIPLCLSLFLTSCNDNDEETVVPVVSELDADMRGEWTNTSVQRVYYSINDTVMYADTSERQAKFRFDGRKLAISLPGNSKEDVWEYSFPDKDNTNYIQLKQGNNTTDYMVTSVSDTMMVWVDELQWAGFPEEAADQDKTTSKVGVYTWIFKRNK